MRRIATPLFAALGVAALLAGCAQEAEFVEENKYKIGTPLAVGMGGVIGGQEALGWTGALGLGLVGAGIGYAVAPYLEKRDLVFIDKALDDALVAPTGTAVAWENPNSGNSGTVTPIDDLDDEYKDRCRSVRTLIKAGPETEVEEHEYCRDRHGGPWYLSNT